MKIEAKLALNNMRKNKKRTLYTTISLILCTMLILTTLILISSIRNGVSENFETEYNDYHIILKNLSPERFNTIKNKTYIDKIYIQTEENEPIERVDKTYNPTENITVYLKYDNIRKTCEYSNDIIKQLNLSEFEVANLLNNVKFNQKLFTVYGLIDPTINIQRFEGFSPVINCIVRVDYSYVIDIMIMIVIVTFSIFFIVILYNAFLITINERKKEYAILNSVGGTEGQIIKMIFIEAMLMGIISIFLGGHLAILSAKFILTILNDILENVGYYFNFVFSEKYIVFSLLIIIINIYLSILIPSIKASSTSVIQGIRNNKQIKYKHKRKKSILEKILPVEGKIAVKNIKRNRSKYRVITLLLVVSITSFIAMSTYLKYEKETADLIMQYDVDAEISFMPEYISENKGTVYNIDYKDILKEYEEKYKKDIEYIEYMEIKEERFLVEPAEVILVDNNVDIYREVLTYTDNSKSISMNIIALDEEKYNQYIEQINANYGDIIIYNNVIDSVISSKKGQYRYLHAFSTEKDFTLYLVNFLYTNINENENYLEYEIINTDISNRKYFLTDEYPEWFKEIKIYSSPTLFVNSDMYNKINNDIEKTYGKLFSHSGEETTRQFWNNGDTLRVKIKCDNIIEFKNYMDEKIKDSNNAIIDVKYYTLENAEKLLYIEILELILKVVMIAIVSIGIISTINIMNASLIERKENFNILYRIGATKGNIKKILLYEGIYMFVKAVIISAILSIPIIYGIIKHMENVIILNQLLIPFTEIGIFVAGLFMIMLIITLCSTKMIKEE